METSGELSATVARHYNELSEGGLEQRVLSRIFYLRNFNNWIKSMAIADTLAKIRQDKSSGKLNILDLGSGKGGDLLKWKKGRVDHVVCADIASTSVEQSESRYNEMTERNKRERFPEKLFTAEFYSADCTKTRLKDKYKNPDIMFDLVSCQFVLHYSFESYQQADMMLRNACESLKPGGYFIGTIPNCYELIKRLRNSESNSFGNEVYKINFRNEDKINLPLFGCQYDFFLEGVVDCPEFVVYLPLLEKMAAKYGMKLVMKKSFTEFYEEMIKQNDGRSLIGKMQGLEPYPPDKDIELMCKHENAYTNAKNYIESLQQSSKDEDDVHSKQHSKYAKNIKVGTLSEPEWEALTVYLVFVFQKLSSSDFASLKRSLEEDHVDNISPKKVRQL